GIDLDHGGQDGGGAPEEGLDDLADGDFRPRDGEGVIEAHVHGEVFDTGEGMGGDHDGADAHVAAEGDIDLTGCAGNEAEADIDPLLDQPVDDFAGGNDREVDGEARI